MGRVGRNQPCPCGSGQKYKRCCGSPTKAPSTPTVILRYTTPYAVDQGLLEMLRAQLDQLCLALYDRNDAMIRFLSQDITQTLSAPALKQRYLEVIREVGVTQRTPPELLTIRLKTAAERFDAEPIARTVQNALLHLVRSIMHEYIWESEPHYSTMAVFAEAAFWLALEPQRYIKQNFSFMYMTFYVSESDDLIRLEISGKPGEPSVLDPLDSRPLAWVQWVDIDRTERQVVRSRGGQTR